MAKESVTIYISDLGGTAEDGSTLSRCQFQIDETPLVASLGSDLVDEMKGFFDDIDCIIPLPGDDEAGVFVRADQTVDVQYIVNVIDAVNQINKERNTKHKVVLGTKPSK